ncbi:apoptosis inhibitory protein 5-domain-containing protein [Hysterangium stoloniferum]|nr:apoptosis inhibitory protein 5-domain-containing protein [Hysterangium stoloniferum]
MHRGSIPQGFLLYIPCPSQQSKRRNNFVDLAFQALNPITTVMNKEDEDRQIRETRSLLQKAGQRNAPLDIKRDALRRLIGLTRTSSRELKVFAAQNFSHYFKDFPDLEEEVIDSVYDICEDPDSSVRIEGYKSIVALSSELRKWTKRNTDVLVQLLQSEEPTELKQIQESLIAHIGLDPPAAIGVLCDHCSLYSDLTAEEKDVRERLRKLVVFFIANTARKDIFMHFRGSTSEAEQVFRDGLLKAIPDADNQDMEVIVKDLLFSLASFKTRSEYGDQLLRHLLDKTQTKYAELKSSTAPVSLTPIQPYLSLLEYVAVARRAAYPGPLLRFYHLTLIGKMAMQKLDHSSQVDIIRRLSDVLVVSEEVRQKQTDSVTSQELTTLRNLIVDACPHLLERLVKSHTDDRRHWKATVALLNACRQRQKDQKWLPPTNLTPTINELNTLAERAPSALEDLAKQVLMLIKELRTVKAPQAPTPLVSSGSFGAQKRKFDGGNVGSIAPVLPASNLSSRMSDNWRRKEPQTPVDFEPSPRGRKLINRLGGDISLGVRVSTIETTPKPLVRRLSGPGSASNGTPVRFPDPPGTADDAVSAGSMLSIKGAASKLAAKEVPAAPQQVPTLMDRMRMDELPRDGQGGSKRKRRSKPVG